MVQIAIGSLWNGAVGEVEKASDCSGSGVRYSGGKQPASLEEAERHFFCPMFA